MANLIELWAPWMSSTEAEALIDSVNRQSTWERKPKGQALGQRLRVTNAEREKLRLWTIAPCDMSKADLAEQKKTKARFRMKLYRQKLREKKGKLSRSNYLANSLTRVKPWKVEGISRATWYRRKTKLKPSLRQVPYEANVFIDTHVTCLTEQADRPHGFAGVARRRRCGT